MGNPSLLSLNMNNFHWPLRESEGAQHWPSWDYQKASLPNADTSDLYVGEEDKFWSFSTFFVAAVLLVSSIDINRIYWFMWQKYWAKENSEKPVEKGTLLFTHISNTSENVHTRLLVYICCLQKCVCACTCGCVHACSCWALQLSLN